MLKTETGIVSGRRFVATSSLEEVKPIRFKLENFLKQASFYVSYQMNSVYHPSILVYRLCVIIEALQLVSGLSKYSKGSSVSTQIISDSLSYLSFEQIQRDNGLRAG